MAARLPLSKDGVLQPAGWAAKRRSVGYLEELHRCRCKAPAITEEPKREQGMDD